MEYEGTLKVKWDPNLPDALHGYIVSYVPYHGGPPTLPIRRLRNEDELRSFLLKVGLDQSFVEDVVKAVLVFDQHDIPHVRLAGSQIAKLFEMGTM